LPGTDLSGASRGNGRVSFRAGAGSEGRARGRARSSPRRQVSPDRAGLAARQEGGCPRDRCRSRTDASGSPGAGGGRPRCGAPAQEGVPRAASCWRRQQQHLSPRGGQLSRAKAQGPRCGRPSYPACLGGSTTFRGRLGSPDRPPRMQRSPRLHAPDSGGCCSPASASGPTCPPLPTPRGSQFARAHDRAGPRRRSRGPGRHLGAPCSRPRLHHAESKAGGVRTAVTGAGRRRGREHRRLETRSQTQPTSPLTVTAVYVSFPARVGCPVVSFRTSRFKARRPG
jgi:hypothetical protein